MTQTETRSEAEIEVRSADPSMHELDAPRPIVSTPSFLGSADHKVTGALYLAGGVIGVTAAVIINILIGIERIDGGSRTFGNSLPQLFDAQRVLMLFGALIPLGLAISVAFVPLQVGSRSIAFGRAAALGFWLWLGGLILNVASLIGNGGTAGDQADMVDLFILSLGIMAVGVTLTAGTVATTVLATRAPGMTMRRVPFFSWSALITALGIILVMPVFVGTLIYLFVDHRNARAGFGGNTGIFTWVGWLFTQPTIYLFALPAIGVFAEILPVTFRKRTPARGFMIGGLALVAVAALAGVTQQSIQSLPWSGSGLNLNDLGTKVDNLTPFAIFYLLPMLGLLLVLVMALVLAKPQKGVRPNFTSGLLFAFFGYGMVLVGMGGAVLYAIDDLALRTTVFEEAIFVYVVYGAVLGVLGGIVYWAPKLWGLAPSWRQVAPLALLGLLATVLSSFPHYIAGFLDQPSGADYTNNDLTVWNVLVLIGHSLMVITLLAFVGLMVSVARRGAKEGGGGDDPWDAQTLEWATTSPAPADNFAEVPLVHSAEPLLDLKMAQLERADTESPV
jgi:heme/copper-type cytochrome/quinol oxidase subunit 1